MVAICYNCVHRGASPGSAHSSCNHPKVTAAKDDPLKNIMAIFASVGRVGPVVAEEFLDLGVVLDPHGVKNGWCNFPWDFDPIWIKSCEGFEKK